MNVPTQYYTTHLFPIPVSVLPSVSTPLHRTRIPWAGKSVTVLFQNLWARYYISTGLRKEHLGLTWMVTTSITYNEPIFTARQRSGEGHVFSRVCLSEGHKRPVFVSWFLCQRHRASMWISTSKRHIYFRSGKVMFLVMSVSLSVHGGGSQVNNFEQVHVMGVSCVRGVVPIWNPYIYWKARGLSSSERLSSLTVV